MTIAMIAALKFREIKILKRKQIFSQGRLPFASNLNDATVKLLFQKYGDWYSSVSKNIFFSFFCLSLLGIMLIFFKIQSI